MMPGFDLVEEPWIPILGADNKRQELGLYEVLAQAHEIREIYDPSPLVVTALHRLLLAILHRNFGPESLDEWKELWQRGRWDELTLGSYFERWRGRFDLFHPERPFYQVPEMANIKKHPVQLLALEAAAGNNPTLFDHSISISPIPLSAARAARYLLARQAYSIGFGKSQPFYFKDSSLIRGYAVLIIGNNLWETLAMNMVAYNSERPFPWAGEDLPAWEKEAPPEPDEKGNIVRGYVDYLTWQSRMIHLFPEGSPLVVNWCQLQQNLMLPKMLYLDPVKSYIADKEEGWRPRGIISEKSVWRDSHSLFQAADQSRSRPEIFEWASRINGLRRSGEISAQETYGFIATGLATDIGKAANIVLWRQERLPLPLAYLEDNENLLGTLKNALSMAEDASTILELYLRVVALMLIDQKIDAERYLREIAIRIFEPESRERLSGRLYSKEVKNFLKNWGSTRLYFSRLEAPFRNLMLELPEDQHLDEDEEIEYGRNAVPEWGRVLRRDAWEVFNTIASGLGGSPRALKAVAQVEGRLHAALTGKISTGGDHGQ